MDFVVIRYFSKSCINEFVKLCNCTCASVILNLSFLFGSEARSSIDPMASPYHLLQAVNIWVSSLSRLPSFIDCLLSVNSLLRRLFAALKVFSRTSCAVYICHQFAQNQNLFFLMFLEKPCRSYRYPYDKIDQ